MKQAPKKIKELIAVERTIDKMLHNAQDSLGVATSEFYSTLLDAKAGGDVHGATLHRMLGHIQQTIRETAEHLEAVANTVETASNSLKVDDYKHAVATGNVDTSKVSPDDLALVESYLAIMRDSEEVDLILALASVARKEGATFKY